MTRRKPIEFFDDHRVVDPLDPARREMLEVNLRLCPDCADSLESYRRTIVVGKGAYPGAANRFLQRCRTDLSGRSGEGGPGAV